MYSVLLAGKAQENVELAFSLLVYEVGKVEEGTAGH